MCFIWNGRSKVINISKNNFAINLKYISINVTNIEIYKIAFLFLQTIVVNVSIFLLICSCSPVPPIFIYCSFKHIIYQYIKLVYPYIRHAISFIRLIFGPCKCFTMLHGVEQEHYLFQIHCYWVMKLNGNSTQWDLFFI